ncbi:hypothetical protein BV202_01772B, partial [Haemophilus influenzae]
FSTLGQNYLGEENYQAWQN